jgi:hypothetical protein
MDLTDLGWRKNMGRLAARSLTDDGNLATVTVREQPHGVELCRVRQADRPHLQIQPTNLWSPAKTSLVGHKRQLNVVLVGQVIHSERRCWSLWPRFLSSNGRAGACSGAADRRLSAFDLNQEMMSDNLVGPAFVNANRYLVAGSGFSAELRDALEQRKDELIRRGQDWRTPAGEFRARANLIETLRR